MSDKVRATFYIDKELYELLRTQSDNISETVNRALEAYLSVNDAEKIKKEIEPFSSSHTKRMEALKNLHKKGNTIILVTHEEDIAKHCHRIIRLIDGEVSSDNVNKDITRVSKKILSEVE